MMAYTFNGYWKDVGTIDSLWEANMELLGKTPEFDIRGEEREKIYARNDAHPSSYIDAGAKTVNCFIAEGCEIYGTIRHSVISVGCTIGKNALVEDSVVMPGVVIEPGAIVRHAILGENSKVCRNAVVGGAFEKDEAKQLMIPIDPSALTVVNDEGQRIAGSGSWTLYAGLGQPDSRTEELTGKKVLSVKL
jgi:glucose-1-phosphate adenylyltransferase